MMWLLSYVGSNFALIAVVVIAVIALGALAWFAKNWKLTVAAACVLGAGLAYQQIDKTAYQRRVSEEAARNVKVLNERIATLNKANQADAERAIQDAATIAELQAQAANTPANGGPCLDRDTAGRVRSVR